MKKNCIVLLILLILNMTMFPVYSADDANVESVNPYSKYQNLLTALDLMSYNSEGEIDNSKEITRAEFVDVVAKLISVNPTVVATSSYFYDVPVNAWYTNAINTLTEYGIIDQNAEKMFYPDKVITVNEANKMLVCLLGYRLFALQNGGYPQGFNAIGANIGLFNGLPEGTNMTNAHLSVMLYNALDADVVNSNANGMKYEVTNENILEQRRNIFKSEGVIESVYGLSLYGKDVLGMNEVIIDNETYKTDQFEELTKHFGEKVRFYFRADEDDELELVYFEPYFRNEASIEILSDDLKSFDPATNVVTYSVGSRTKRATLSGNAVVLRNGTVVKSKLNEAFSIANGELKLIDSNNDNTYDVCCIYDFKTVVANNVSVDPRVLTYKMISDTKDNYHGVFDFSDKSVDNIVVYSSVGTVVDFAAITVNTVLDIAISEDNKNVIIYINSDMVEGRVGELAIQDEKIFINDEEYGLYNSVIDIFRLNTNSSGKFKLNRYGKVSYFESTKQDSEKNPAVYLVNVTQDDVDKDICWVKYFDSTGNFNVKQTHNKIKIDGERITFELYEELSKLKRSIVLLTLNSEDKIISVDSSQQTNNEDKSSLKKMLAFNGDGTKWNATTKMFGKNIVCSSDAAVFIVPPMQPGYEEYAYDTQSYSIGSFSDLESNLFNDVDCYSFGDTSYCNVIVLYKYKYQNTHKSRFMMVTNIAEVLDLNDNIVTRITGYQAGELVSHDVTNQYKIGSAPDADIALGVGDIITVGRKDNDGLVGNVEVHFDLSRNWSGLEQVCVGGYMFDSYANRNYDALYYWVNIFTDLQAFARFIPGCPLEVDGKLVKIAYPAVDGGRDSKGIYKWRRWKKPESFDQADEIVILKDNTPIIVYDADSKKVTKGSVTDIHTADTYECPSQIFVDAKWGEVMSVFVVNNNDEAWTKPDVIEE